MRVLVVDDDETTILLVRTILEEAGHEVHVATSGESAEQLLEQKRIRIVITDWMMPGISGLELCRRIRSAPERGYVYVMILTSRDAMIDSVAGLAAGADDFITKPFNPEELLLRTRTAERILSLETRDVTIFALAKLAESRDSETGAHLERVRSISRLLALELKSQNVFADEIDDSFVQLLFETSPLHDIGKVGIPDCVLLKPGRLDPAEFEIMKTHTTIGAATLDAAAHQFPETRFLTMARDIARHHHERFDGQGYPDGLTGDEIPLAARIVAVADVYDAITSRRVYKSASTHEIAIHALQEDAGVHFDPRVVSAFVAIQHECHEIRTQLADPAPPAVPA